MTTNPGSPHSHPVGVSYVIVYFSDFWSWLSYWVTFYLMIISLHISRSKLILRTIFSQVGEMAELLKYSLCHYEGLRSVTQNPYTKANKVARPWNPSTVTLKHEDLWASHSSHRRTSNSSRKSSRENSEILLSKQRNKQKTRNIIRMYFCFNPTCRDVGLLWTVCSSWPWLSLCSSRDMVLQFGDVWNSGKVSEGIWTSESGEAGLVVGGWLCF